MLGWLPSFTIADELPVLRLQNRRFICGLATKVFVKDRLITSKASVDS
jgi:hypothetical protein